MPAHTKIICTIGPSVNTQEKIIQLIDAGMNVARLNFSHGTHEDHLQSIQFLKKAREMRKVPLAIMMDTKGPEIRVGKIKNGSMELKKGQKLLLVKEAVEGTSEKVQILPGITLESLKAGDLVLFDDGYISTLVASVTSDGALVEIQNDGVLKTGKGVNVPGVNIPLPAMTEQDIKDIAFGCKHDIDIIAASFIRSADHVLEIKHLLVEQGKSDILVIAKIENSLGVQNFDSIIQVADGIMVARGDLGVELPLKQVPILQKMMIRKCYLACKPVVTATQMLESMIKNPRPTRAEVSDVANAIYDSTSAVMLSGETAVGSYPIEAVAMMKSIVEETEKDFPYRDFFHRDSKNDVSDVSSSVALASVKTGYSTGAKAIFAFTHSGSTARIISRYRPQMPILALTPDPKTYNQLAFNWGVIPVDPTQAKNAQEAIQAVSCFAMKKGLIRYGDLVVITAGEPFGISGTTNMMIVESIGDVLIRAHPGRGEKIHGKVTLVPTSDTGKHTPIIDRIVVISRCDESYKPFLQKAIGIVLQNHPEDIESEKFAMQYAKSLDIPILTRAEGAFSLLQEGQLVTLDPERGILYKGSVASDEEMLPKICSTDS